MTDRQPDRAARRERTDQAFQPGETVQDARVGARMIVPIVIVLIGVAVLLALLFAPR